jgi:hypothetical protein
MMIVVSIVGLEFDMILGPIAYWLRLYVRVDLILTLGLTESTLLCEFSFVIYKLYDIKWCLNKRIMKNRCKKGYGKGQAIETINEQNGHIIELVTGAERSFD